MELNKDFQHDYRIFIYGWGWAYRIVVLLAGALQCLALAISMQVELPDIPWRLPVVLLLLSLMLLPAPAALAFYFWRLRKSKLQQISIVNGVLCIREYRYGKLLEKLLPSGQRCTEYMLQRLDAFSENTRFFLPRSQKLESSQFVIDLLAEIGYDRNNHLLGRYCLAFTQFGPRPLLRQTPQAGDS